MRWCQQDGEIEEARADHAKALLMARQRVRRRAMKAARIAGCMIDELPTDLTEGPPGLSIGPAVERIICKNHTAERATARGREARGRLSSKISVL